MGKAHKMSKLKKRKTIHIDKAYAKHNKINIFSSANRKNAFELHVNKARFKILGRTCHHDKGLPGASRGIALQMRKQTIGKEFEQDNRRNNFKDHRIGAESEVFHNKLINARFIAEKMSVRKKSRRFDFKVEDLSTHRRQVLKEEDHFLETFDRFDFQVVRDGLLIPGINKQLTKDRNPDELKNGENNVQKIFCGRHLSGVQPENVSNKDERKIKHLDLESEKNTYYETYVKNESKSQKMENNVRLVIEMPSNYKQLKDLLSKHCVDSQTILVDRILKSYYLKQDYKNQKIVKFFGFLIQYMSEIFNNPLMEKVANSFKIFNNICPHLNDIMNKNTKDASVCLLNVIRKIYSKNMRNYKAYPSLKTLVILKMVSNLYTTSNNTNLIISLCYHFISQILCNAKVRTRQDIAKGLYLVTLSLEYSRFSHHLIPAVLNFLKAVIQMSIPNTQIKNFKPITSSISSERNILEVEEDPKKKLDGNLNQLLVAEDLVATTISPDFKIRAFNLALNLTKDAIEGISSNKGSKYFAESFIPLMRKINISVYPKYVKSNFESLMLSFLTINGSPMKKLMSVDKQDNALHFFEPLVETIYDDKRRTKLSKEKEEKLKIKQKIRRETKGAVRDIRRDAEFLQKMQIIQRVQSDRVRKEKVKSIFVAASIQQGELNALKKQKAKV